MNDSRVKIIDPATSALALTVGSLSLCQRSAHRWFAKTLAGFEEFPSPFTRTGPGVNGMLKPNLVELSGDLSIERGSGIVTDPSVGVITTEKDFLTEGLFRVEDGTSFSAAKVSHLAAKLCKERPTATSTLIKALLTASAKIPEIRPPPLDKLDLKKGLADEDSDIDILVIKDTEETPPRRNLNARKLVSEPIKEGVAGDLEMATELVKKIRGDEIMVV